MLPLKVTADLALTVLPSGVGFVAFGFVVTILLKRGVGYDATEARIPLFKKRINRIKQTISISFIQNLLIVVCRFKDFWVCVLGFKPRKQTSDDEQFHWL